MIYKELPTFSNKDYREELKKELLFDKKQKEESQKLNNESYKLYAEVIDSIYNHFFKYVEDFDLTIQKGESRSRQYVSIGIGGLTFYIVLVYIQDRSKDYKYVTYNKEYGLYCTISKDSTYRVVADTKSFMTMVEIEERFIDFVKHNSSNGK